MKKGKSTIIVESQVGKIEIDQNPSHFKKWMVKLTHTPFFANALKTKAKSCGYDGDISDLKALKKFIIDRLISKGGTRSDKRLDILVPRWLKGDTVPTREHMYNLCFAFELNLKSVQYFFDKACLEIPFNFRKIEETVFYFCFKNKLSYNDSVRILNEIERKKVLDEANEQILTKQIKENIDGMSEEEFINYCATNYWLFCVDSNSAIKMIYSHIQKYRELLADTDYNSKADDAESTKDENNKNKKENKKKKRVSTRRIIASMYGVHIKETPTMKAKKKREKEKKEGDAKKDGKKDESYKIINESIKNLPAMIKKNLPQEGILNKIINYIEKGIKPKDKITEDAARRALIMLSFFDFYGSAIEGADGYKKYYDEFRRQLDTELTECGYGPLYVRNPYDFMFVYSANQIYPILAFHSIMFEYGFGKV